jgi:hypothetical protein
MNRPCKNFRKLIIYHGNCYDGFGAAWAAWKKFGIEAEYLPMSYGQSFPDDGWGRDCYVLDFSFPSRNIGARQLDQSYVLNVTDFKVIDHHKTAEADLKDYPGCCIFDMNKSGAVLAWEFFHPDKEIPRLLEYVQDRDLWRFELPESRAVSTWMRSWPMSFETWNELEERILDFDSVIVEALAIERFTSEMVKIMADNAWTQDVGGWHVPVANATAFFSEVGEELCRRNPHAPFSGYYLDRRDRKRQWGLRSRGEFDVSEVAKHKGGGGHKNAAGFTEDLVKGG